MEKARIELERFILSHWHTWSDREIAEKFCVTTDSVVVIRGLFGLKKKNGRPKMR